MVKRIAVVGPYFTGKSSLILRYLKKGYGGNSYCATMTSDVSIDSQKNVIWDTPGQLRWYEDLADVSKKVNGFVLCFTPSDDESFHKALTLIDGININKKPVVIAATKTDILPFEIKPQWSSEASIRGWKLIRTSAATSIGITHVFKEIFDLTEDTEEVALGRLEYVTGQMGSCIYTGINNYIYELDTEDC